MIELTKEYIDHLKDIITEKDDAKIKEILDELYPADIAELYQVLDLQDVYKRQFNACADKFSSPGVTGAKRNWTFRQFTASL